MAANPFSDLIPQQADPFADLVPQEEEKPGLLERLGFSWGSSDVPPPTIPPQFDRPEPGVPVPGAVPLGEAGNRFMQSAVSMAGKGIKDISIGDIGARRAAGQTGDPYKVLGAMHVPYKERGSLLQSLQLADEMAGRDPEQTAQNLVQHEASLGLEDVQDDTFYRAGQAVSDYARETFPTDPQYDESMVAKFIEGGGSLATFGAATFINPALGAMLGANVNASIQFTDALNNGASFDEALDSARLGRFVGSTEVVPIAAAGRRMDKLTGGMFSRVMKDKVLSRAQTVGLAGLSGAVEEGLQEGFVEVANNLVARDLVGYDPERGYFDHAGEAAGIGSGLGFLMNILTGSLGSRRTAIPKRIEGPTDSPQFNAGFEAADSMLQQAKADRAQDAIDLEQQLGEMFGQEQQIASERFAAPDTLATPSDVSIASPFDDLVPAQAMPEVGMDAPETGMESTAPAGPAGMLSDFNQASRESFRQLRSEIGPTRWGPDGTILFDFRGTTYAAPDPGDVIPVDTGDAEAESAWALRQLLDKNATPVDGPAGVQEKAAFDIPEQPSELNKAVQGTNFEAIQMDDGRWLARSKLGGRWQDWEERESLDTSSIFGLQPMSTANKSGRRHIPGYGYFQVEEPDTAPDMPKGPPDLLDEIADAGGLDRQAWISEGVVDEEGVKGVGKVGRPVFPREGGMTPDHLKEWMQEMGYLPPKPQGRPDETGADEAMSLVHNALSGERVVAPRFDVEETEYQAEVRALDEMEREEFEAEAGDVLTSEYGDNIPPEVYDEIRETYLSDYEAYRNEFAPESEGARPADGPQGRTGREAEIPQPGEAETDLLGEVPATEQAIADAERRVDERLAPPTEVPVEAGEGGLFSGEQRQRDFVSEGQQPRPALPSGPFYRGAPSDAQSAVWWTPDQEAAAEYRDLHGDGRVSQRESLELRNPATSEDIRDVLTEMGEKPGRDVYYYHLSPEQYARADEVIQRLKDRGHDGVYLREGEDFAPSGKAIESVMVFEDQAESTKAQPRRSEARPTSGLTTNQLTDAISRVRGLKPDQFNIVQSEAELPTSGTERLMTAFHGSPHRFDRFDLSKVGTGEGVQAYGHGIYLAESEGTAKHYAQGSGSYAAHQRRAEDMGLEMRDYLKKLQAGEITGGPHLYEVDLPDEAIDRMLDWDKPLSEQPEAVQRAIEVALADDPVFNRWKENGSIKQVNGGILYRQIVDQQGSARGGTYGAQGEQQAAASDYLNSQGIPGIKYFDATSRTAGEGTRNFVVFDDSIITVLSRNGEPVESPRLSVTAPGEFAARRAARGWQQVQDEYREAQERQQDAQQEVDDLMAERDRLRKGPRAAGRLSEVMDRLNVAREELRVADQELAEVEARKPPFQRNSELAGGPEGVFDPATGQIYLVADNISSPERAQWVAWHEQWHRGARVSFSDEFNARLDEAGQNHFVSRLANAVLRDRPDDPAMSGPHARRAAVEEALAELNAAQRTGDYSHIKDRYGLDVPTGQRAGWKGAVARFFEWLGGFVRRLTGNDRLTDGRVFEIVRGADMEAAAYSAQSRDDMARLMTAFHGSPHEFAQFDMSKVGTGEGAQVYGHGIYLAERPGVAKTYMSAGRYVDSYDARQRASTLAGVALMRSGGDRDAAIRELSELIDSSSGSTFQMKLQGAISMIREGTAKGPNLYEVDLPDEAIARMLDWDKPLSEQPTIKEAFAKIARQQDSRPLMEEVESGRMTAGGIYKMAASGVGNSDMVMDSRAISEALNQQGIPGIKYLDATSRKEGEGTHNFVVFDDSIIKVLSRNGEPVDSPRYSRAPKLDFNPDFSNYTLPSRATYERLKTEDMRLIDRIVEGTAEKRFNWRQKLQDKMLPLKRAQEAIEESGGTVSDFANVYEREQLIHGTVGHQFTLLERDVLDPMTRLMARKDVTREELGEYLYARHAKARNARIANVNESFPDGGSGMTNAEADTILERVKSEGRLPVLKRLAQYVDQITAKTRDNYKEYGLLDRRVVEEWEKDSDFNSTYVPLKGFADAERETFGRPGQGYDIRGTEVKRALGRRSEPADILGNVIADYKTSVLRGEKNQVGQSLLKLAADHPNENLWEINPVKTKFVIDKETGMAKEVADISLNDPNMFYTKVNGKAYRIELKDSRMATAMKNLGADNMGSFMRALASVTRYLSMTRTMLAPEFVVSNFARDLQTAGVNLQGEQGTKFRKKAINRRAITGAMRALFNEARAGNKGDQKWLQYAKEFRADGGHVDFFREKSVEQYARDVDKLAKLARKGTWSQAKRAGRGTLKFIEDVNGAVENALRLSAYRSAREVGLSRQKAAVLAKNLTVNFNKKGLAGPHINALFMFYNASIQGTVRLFQAAKHPMVRRLLYTMAASGAVQTLINELAGGEDDDGESYYQKIPDFEKYRNLILMIPEPLAEKFRGLPGVSEVADGKGLYFKFPLPYGYSIPYVAGEAAMSTAFGTDPMTAATRVVLAVNNSFNPVGDTQLSTLFAPTLADPFIEILTNRNYFGGPIHAHENPFEDVKTPDAEEGWDTTGRAYRWTARFLNKASGGDEVEPGAVDLHPETIRHVFEFATGGTGTFFERVYENLEAAFSDKTELDPNRIVFARKVFGTTRDYVDRDRYYRNRETLLVMEKRFDLKRQQVASGELPRHRMDEWREDHSDILGSGLIQGLKSTEKRLRKLRKLRKEVKAQPDSPAKQKRLDDIEQQILDTQIRFNTRYNDVMLDKGIVRSWIEGGD